MSATGDSSSSCGTSSECPVAQGNAQPQPRRMTRDDDSRSSTPAASGTEAPSSDRQYQDVAKGDEKPIYDSSPVSGVLVKSATTSLCCGYDPTLGVLETQTAERVDEPDITVTTSGRFPCLHIALRGLKDTTYYVAIDFVEVKGDDKGIFYPIEYSDPYYIPCQNHLQGQQWMSKPRYYNLSAIINGWLETYSCVLKESGEYVPTVRLLEYPRRLSKLCKEVIRLELPASTFIISSEVIQESQNGSPHPNRRILLKLKSDITTEREASRNEPTFRSPESSTTLSDSERLATSMADMTIRLPPSAELSDSRRLATGVANMPSRSPSPAALRDSQHVVTSVANMPSRSPSPATPPGSQHMATSMSKMASRPPSPATLSDSPHMPADMAKMANRSPPTATLSHRQRLPTNRAFTQTPVRVRAPQVALAPRLPYMSAGQPWLLPPRVYRLPYIPTYPPPELCRICQQVWTMGCPICPTCQVLRTFRMADGAAS